MGFIVVYQGADGSPACAEHESLHDAAQFVEQLCNDHGIHAARILHAEEVPFDVRPYYRVQLGVGEEPAPVAPVAARSGVPADWATFAERRDAIEAVENVIGALDVDVPPPPPPAPALVTPPSPLRIAEDAAVLRRGLFGR